MQCMGDGVAKCTALTQLDLHDNPSLTIAEATKNAIIQAAPNAKFWWPEVQPSP